MDDPLLDHATVEQLSPSIHILSSRASLACVAISFYAIIPASSKSEMEMDPVGFLAVTSASETGGGNLEPYAAHANLASLALMSSEGAVGTSSRRCVGRTAK